MKICHLTFAMVVVVGSTACEAAPETSTTNCSQFAREFGNLAEEALRVGLPPEPPESYYLLEWSESYQELLEVDAGYGFLEISLLREWRPGLYRRLREMWDTASSLGACALPEIATGYETLGKPDLRLLLARGVEVLVHEMPAHMFEREVEASLVQMVVNDPGIPQRRALLKGLKLAYLHIMPRRLNIVADELTAMSPPACGLLEQLADLFAEVAGRYPSEAESYFRRMKGLMSGDSCQDEIALSFSRHLEAWRQTSPSVVDEMASNLLTGGETVQAGLVTPVLLRKLADSGAVDQDTSEIMVKMTKSNDAEVRCAAVAALENVSDVPREDLGYDPDELAAECVMYPDYRNEWPSEEKKAFTDQLDEASEFWHAWWRESANPVSPESERR